MNAVVITMQDKSGAGKVTGEIDITFHKSTVTVREIIEARVKTEVQRYNNKVTDVFHGLVQPSEAEKTLNGYKMKTKHVIDAEKQVYVALDAFMKNGYIMLINKYQPENLEEVVNITPDTQISFLKLTPLVGG